MMRPMSSRDIRQGFLDFFRRADHKIIEGATVVPKDDPSLLFINAGMAPLKPYFLGHKKPENPRMANVQPCIRTKDIADVGDRHHLTMFEMLGSWSIGDYFKDRACELAYQLLVEVLKFDPKRLYTSCYAGDATRGIPADDVSARAWERCGIPSDRIVMLGEDNFWSAGDTGPCGPCTEVFFDCGDAYGSAYVPGGEFDSKRRYIEIWNAGVFMEFNRRSDGNLEPLPFKSVDTGSGLERMSMVMNGHDSVYDTDLFAPLMKMGADAFPSLSSIEYRILADHMRAASFILSAGITVSNEGQGYIPRRLLRRCIALAYRGGHDARNLLAYIKLIRQELDHVYPYLGRGRDHIETSLTQEISEFEPVIKTGIKLFESRLKHVQGSIVPGSIAFELVSTHGLPLDVIASLAHAKGLSVDEDGYHHEFKKHQDTSRVLSGSQKFHGDEASVLADVSAKLEGTQFEGYNQLTLDAKVLSIIKEDREAAELAPHEEGHVIFSHTPFYAESGGQIADTGTIAATNNSTAIAAKVLDCQKKGDVYIHRINVLEGTIKTNQSYTLRVDASNRDLIEQNHSATHLLHSALRQHLGTHVVQKGSMVQAHRLRFDFQHPQALSPTELAAVEGTVNEWIWADLSASIRHTSFDAAVATGAMALFGENYGENVRVVKFGDASTELCGGCHVGRTGTIGLFLIVTESSVAKGVRRIEAITGKNALAYAQTLRSTLKEASETLGVSSEGITEAVQKLRKQLKDTQKSAQKPNLASGATAFSHRLDGEACSQNFMIAYSSLGRDGLTHAVGETLSREKKDIAVIVQSSDSDTTGTKGSLMVFVAPQKVHLLDAKAVLSRLLEPLGGRGGGKPHFAQGGYEYSEGFVKLIPKIADEMPAVIKSLVR